jgi:3-oxoacyl-[acyl-carrier protein] reductase
MRKLEGQVAIVTGGQRGLGAAIVREFYSAGARCVINYPPNEEREASALVAEIQSDKGTASAVMADVSDWDQVHQMVPKVVEMYGRLDILVNNAGVNPLRTWDDLNRADWDSTLAVNLTGVFNCCKAVLPEMRKRRKGNIINIASIAAYIGRGNVDYIATKSALTGLTRSLARQYGRDGIRANAISPGFHDTEMSRRARGNAKENADEFINQVPLGFFPKPDSIGKAALYLASDDSYYVTGHELVVDGGLTLR